MQSFSWQAPEFKWQETPTKITAIIAITSLLIAGASAIFGNYVLALLVIIFLVVVIILKGQKPQTLDVTIDQSGFKYGQKFYTWSDLKKFWIVYQPPETKTLHFKPKGPLSLEIVIQLENQNPNELREFLLDILDEDDSDWEENLSDKIMRMLKI